MASSEMLRRMALVRTDVSEEIRASFIRRTRIGDLGATLAVTSNRLTLPSATVYIDFLDRSRYFFIQVSPQLRGELYLTLLF
jgi:hypothetical protein